LRSRERQNFLQDEWPEIRQRMNRLGIDLSELVEEA